MRKNRAILDAIGREPTFHDSVITSDNYTLELAKALSWYSDSSSRERKKWSLAWSDDTLMGNDLPKLRNVPDAYFVSSGNICRISSNGFPLKQKDIDTIKNRLSKLITHAVEPVNKPVNKPVKTLKETIISLFEDYIEDFLDTGIDTSKKILKLKIDTSNITHKEFNWAMVHFSGMLREFNEYDENNENGYFFDEQKTKKYISILDAIILRLESFIMATKRKVKEKTPKEIVSKLQYMESYDFGGLDNVVVSESPENILGSRLLIVYNTKTRYLTRYTSKTSFNVTGTTISNFDEDDSSRKKLRSPAAYMNLIENADRDAILTVFSHIHSVASPPNGRMNKDCLILRVF